MTPFCPKSISFLSALMLIISAGCTLNEPDQTNSLPALSLEYTTEYSLTHFSWDKVKVTGFKEYILLQSSEVIPDRPTPEINQDVTILKRIKDVDENSFSTSNLLIGEKTCYKLYCAVDDRFMYSPTICIDENYDSFEGFYDKAAHLRGLDEMIAYDRVNDIFSVVNYKTGIKTNSVSDMTFNFPSLEIYQWNNATHVVAFNQSAAWLGVYNFPSMTTIQKRSFSDVCWSARPYKQLIFVASQSAGANFQVLNKSTLLPIDSRNGTISSQNIAIFEGDPTVVLTLGQNGSKRYTVNSNGFILSEQAISGRLSQPDLQNTCAQGSELFIGGNGGDIINRAGENIASLAPGNGVFIAFARFSEDEQKVAYILNKNGAMFLEFADLSNLPAIIVERTIELPALTYSDLIADEDILYVVATTFNTNFAKTFILKFPW